MQSWLVQTLSHTPQALLQRQRSREVRLERLLLLKSLLQLEQVGQDGVLSNTLQVLLAEEIISVSRLREPDRGGEVGAGPGQLIFWNNCLV